jgi:branched-chain amino acid transport system permease protein
MNWLTANIVTVQSTATAFLLALSLQVPIRLGVFSFAGMGLYGVGGYAAGIAVARFRWDTWPALLLGVAFCAAIGLLLGLVLQRLDGLYLGMATIAFVLIVGVIASNGGTFTGGQAGLYGAVGHIDPWQLGVVCLAVIVVLILSERGGMARRIAAVREDHALAASMGVAVGRYRLVSFIVSGLLAGLAGGMNVLMRTTVTPDAIGFNLIVLALTVIVVGGTRSWAGAAIGAVVFSWLPVLLNAVGQWRGVIYGALVVVAAIFFPTGIWGAIASIARAARRRRRTGLAERLNARTRATPVVDLDERGR